ncbi:LOW QUALITY PROTEIN: hypothetical protein BT93_J0013 [Corymbia citriodora subsp. variegata]|nr:LOW QUALITY PROTEIN: hypothetical protein BT93_J0013 [Corymbia citriodora subsp. variegata]
MSPLMVPPVSELQVESFVFPLTAKPPGSDNTLFLGGADSSSLTTTELESSFTLTKPIAEREERRKRFRISMTYGGVRGLEIDGKHVKYTAIGVYLEVTAVPILAVKWKGKSADELRDSIEFFRDVVTGPFEKFTQVSFITQLTGPEYTDKLHCFLEFHGDKQEEAKAIDELIEVFKDQTFPPGSSIFFTHLTNGSYVGHAIEPGLPRTRTRPLEKHDREPVPS